MGKIELDHTGSGSGITLSSDGTSLLLGGTAIGGGGGGADLYAANESSPSAQPSATGINAIAIGDDSLASGLRGMAVGYSSKASGQDSSALGNATASGESSAAVGFYATASGAGAVSIGYSAVASGTFAGCLGFNGKATANSSIALGNSYASGEDSLAAIIDNNTSSYGAGGYSNIAMGVNAKATSGGSTVAIGAGTVASGNFAAAVGANCEATNGGSAFGRASDATGGFSLALGASNLASQFYSVAIGNNAKSEIKGKLAYGSGRFTTNGDVQAGTFILRMASTSGSPAVLTSDGSTTADTINQIVLPNNSAYAFHGTIVARESAGSGTECAAWKVEGLIRREGSAGTTVLVNSATTVLNNAPSWGMALSADTTNGALAITVTGAAKTIRWVATIQTTELTYA